MFKNRNHITSLFIILLSTLSLLFTPITALIHAQALDDVVVTEVEGEYDAEEAEAMKTRIGRIHRAYLNVLAQKGIKMKLINFPLTELNEYAYLAGVVPRGWEGTGDTWDDVPGAGGDPSVARIGYSDPKPENNHDTLNLELHEIAHAIDKYVFDEISFKEPFKAIHDAEQQAFLPDPYFDYPEEYFAEAFAYYYLNEEMRSVMKHNAPKTHEFIKTLPSKIPQATKPKLTLNGESEITIKTKETFEELGATATDDIYGELTEHVKISGEVDDNTPGTYELTYTVTNEAGKTATGTRQVTVIKSRIYDYREYKKDITKFTENVPGLIEVES